MDNPADSDYVDVLIVGAGASGIGAACFLRRLLPHKTWAIVEARDRSGGTWDLFRYPGVRSDSDAFTLSYSFRPWLRPESMAAGADILQYVRDTADEFDVTAGIRFGHRVTRASWVSARAVWRVEVAAPGSARTIEAAYLYVCSGYFDYTAPYDAELPGLPAFSGEVVHPQHWPDSLDLGGRRVVVVGSGATAVSLVPALVGRARSVTMLQRTPSYVLSLPRFDPTSDVLRRVLPPGLAHRAARTKNALVSFSIYQACRRAPGLARRGLSALAARRLPPGGAAAFDPPYAPWDQRLCMVPDGDLFDAVRGGARVVTDTIDRVEGGGIRLASGGYLEADVIVTATGLAVLPAGGIAVDVDGVPVDLGKSWFFRGVLVAGVPNLALCVGYTNATWTLRAELSTRFVCRLLAHLDRIGATVAIPDAPPDDEVPLPLLDLTSGYLARSAHLLPQRSARAPWNLTQNYLRDRWSARFSPVGGRIAFARVPVRPAVPARHGAAGRRAAAGRPPATVRRAAPSGGRARGGTAGQGT